MSNRICGHCTNWSCDNPLHMTGHCTINRLECGYGHTCDTCTQYQCKWEYMRPATEEEKVSMFKEGGQRMSNWTHVAAIIRVDGIAKIDFDEVIGKECLWGSPKEVWKDVEVNPDKYLPMGSEGSLQKSVWENPNKDCLASYTISIFGDLRDHHSTSDIIKWFKEKCKLLWVRNAVITVYNEWNGTETYTYKGEEE